MKSKQNNNKLIFHMKKPNKSKPTKEALYIGYIDINMLSKY